MLKQTLTGSKENEGKLHSFGQSLFVDDDCLLVGADDAPVNGYEDGGVVYKFEKIDGVWTETEIIQGSNTTNDAFYGWDVVKDGDILVVGADDENSYGYCSGAVYVYDNGIQEKILVGSGLEESYFGYSVDIKGNMIAVGEPAYRSTFEKARKSESPICGEVSIFEKMDDMWVTKYVIEPLEKNPSGFFGGQVKFLDDGWLAVSEQGSNAVHFYDMERSSDGFFTLDGGNKFKSFGKSMAFKNGILVIGSLGKVSVWKQKKDGLKHIQTIERGGTFGYSVDYDNGMLVVTDPEVDIDTLEYDNIEELNENKGKTYLFELMTDKFELCDRIVCDGINTGHRVKIRKGELFISSPHENEGKGKVWVYEI